MCKTSGQREAFHFILNPYLLIARLQQNVTVY